MTDETSKLRAEYVQNNRDKFAYYGARQRDNLRIEMIAAYGGKCRECGITKPYVLCLDHINDDAHVEEELYGENARGGHKQYLRLKKAGWPQERFQLLCYNCNAEKEHKRRRDKMIEAWGEEREVDRALSRATVGLSAHNVSGIKGVFWNNQKQKWHSRIMINYEGIHLGFYADITKAALAYREAAKKFWGDTANLPTDEEIAEVAKMHEAKYRSTSSIEDLGL